MNDSETRTKKIIYDIIEKITQLLKKGDLDGILHYYAIDNPLFSAFEDSPPYSRLNGDQFRTFLRNMLDKAANINNEKYDLEISVCGETAIVTGYERWSMQFGEQHLNGIARFTIVLIKHNGEWKIIHEHFTNISH
jgi:ketosteroid isomerase-like protein